MFGRRNGSQAVTSSSRAKRAWQVELADGSGSEGHFTEEYKSKQSDAQTGRASKDKDADGGRKRVRRQGQCSPSNSFDAKDVKRDTRDMKERDRSPVRRRRDRDSSPCQRSSKAADANHDCRHVKQDDQKNSRQRIHRSPSQQGVRNVDFYEDSRNDDRKTHSRRHRHGSPHKERDWRRHRRSLSQHSSGGVDANQVLRRDTQHAVERDNGKMCHRSPSQISLIERQKDRGNQTATLRGRGRPNRSPSRYDPHDDRMHAQRQRRRSQSRCSRNQSDVNQGEEALQVQQSHDRSPSEVGGSEVPCERRSKQYSDDRCAEASQGSRKKTRHDEQKSERRDRYADSPGHDSPARNADEKGKNAKENRVVSPSACQTDQFGSDENGVKNKTDEVSLGRSLSRNACEKEDEEQPRSSPKVDGREDQTQKTTKKEYAWMESGDEADGSSEGALASPPPSFPVAKEVETLGQMLRLAEHLLGQSKEDLQGLEPLELVEICAAAARVKYYDPALFADALAPTLLYRFRRGLDANLMADSKHLTVENALDIVSSLAALNAASATPIADVFRAAARALEEHGTSLTIQQRRLLKDVYKTGGREKDVAFIEQLASPSDPGAIAAAAFKGSQRAGTNGDGLAMRPGARICELYAKTGTCRTGTTCRNDHPESLRVIYNSDGYPLRPWAPNCPYYMNQGTCDFRKTCKWHHPDKRERGGPGNVSYISKGSWASR